MFLPIFRSVKNIKDQKFGATEPCFHGICHISVDRLSVNRLQFAWILPLSGHKYVYIHEVSSAQE